MEPDASRNYNAKHNHSAMTYYIRYVPFASDVQHGHEAKKIVTRDSE